MSQILNLPPGRYNLFITPPVAGVDFSGTPMPTVSYQWRKNGVAITGETFASISGVRVEEEGGTVSLTNGDSISIDIVLSNVVDTVVRNVAATVNSTIPAPVFATVTIRTLVSGAWQTVAALDNTAVGTTIRVASDASGNVTSTPPVVKSYQWRRGFAPIAGATDQSYTLVEADEDSIIDCVVTASTSGGTTTAIASVIVGTLPDAGWTALTPSNDSRLVYIATNGNDASAKLVKGGRGYYLPGDPEVGPDPLNPVGPIVAYANPFEAFRKIRGIGFSHETTDGTFRDVYSRAIRNSLEAAGTGGWPDWMLFRRGDTFLRVNDPDYGNVDVGMMFSNAIASWMTWSYNPLAGNSQRYEGGGISGRSVSEPFVLAAWGPPSAPRPVFHGGFTINAKLRNAVISSIDCQPSSDPAYPGNRNGLMGGNPPESAYGAWRNVLVEDCRTQGHGMIAFQGGGASTNLTLRRCVLTDGWNAGGHNSAPFAGLNANARLAFEECVFDRNGYKENPNEPRTWTAGHSSLLTAGQLPAGTGVQPTRTWFDRNWYLSGASGRTLRVRGNIASRTGGGAEQFRSGGVAERNLLLFSHDGIMATSLYEAFPMVAKGNVHLHDDAMLPPGAYGMNNEVRGGNGGYWIDNVYAHAHHYGQNGGGTLHMLGHPDNTPINGWRAVVQGNVIRSAGTLKGWGIEAGAFANNAADVRNNTIAIDNPPSWLGASPTATPRASDTIDGNLYFGNPAASRFSRSYAGSPRSVAANTTFAQWQAAGYDPNGQMIADWAAFKAAAGWTDPDRDIVSYMQSIDPAYVPNEDVRVDFGCSGPLQEVPQLVRNVVPGTDAQKRLAARRFHAFVTFISRARENRKGAWDSRYTAEAVVNYIREGFGKPPLTGPYDMRDIYSMAGDYST